MEPNPESITENWCLMDGCYKFVVEDEYGDGLYGSQHTCEFDGDFTIYDNDDNILAELNEPNSDFGDDITLNFCIESGLSTSDYSTNTTQFDLFPNPTYGAFVLESKINGQIKIYNTIWQEVHSSVKSDFKHSIDIQDLEDGIYLIEFNNSIKKLIKQ